MKSSEIRERFGMAVRFWKRQLGLTQGELAARSGLHRTYISDVENGTRNLSLQCIEALAGALVVTIPELFQPMPEGKDYLDRNIRNASAGVCGAHKD